MAVHDFLSPEENIKYSSNFMVDFMGDKFYFYLTNRRMIWHKINGFVFKRNSFVAETLEKVKHIQFKEEGIFMKKGTIVIIMGDRKKEFSGDLKNMRVLYGEVQALMDLG